MSNAVPAAMQGREAPLEFGHFRPVQTPPLAAVQRAQQPFLFRPAEDGPRCERPLPQWRSSKQREFRCHVQSVLCRDTDEMNSRFRAQCNPESPWQAHPNLRQERRAAPSAPRTSGATGCPKGIVPPAGTRAGTSQRDIPTSPRRVFFGPVCGYLYERGITREESCPCKCSRRCLRPRGSIRGSQGVDRSRMPAC